MLSAPHQPCLFFFFFNDTATTEIYTLSLHDALPIFPLIGNAALLDCFLLVVRIALPRRGDEARIDDLARHGDVGSVHQTPELQSRLRLECPLLLEIITE